MVLGGQMEHQIWLGQVHSLRYGLAVVEVHLLQLVAPHSSRAPLGEGGLNACEIAGVTKLVEIEDLGAGAPRNRRTSAPPMKSAPLVTKTRLILWGSRETMGSIRLSGGYRGMLFH